MNHKRFVAWLKSHYHTLAWGFLVSAVVVSGVLYVIGNTISDTVINRTSLLDVPVIDLELQAFEASLSGQLVDALDATRPVTAIIIENSPEARPQAGLGDAEVVFESIAEGGITRFVTFWQVERSEKIGPVRSVRPHFNDWIMSFDAAIAHIGGSNQGLAEIRSFGIKDLDQFANADYYYRDSARFSPHNLYTTTELLDSLQAKKGYVESDFVGWEYVNGEAVKTPTANEISIEVSSSLFNVNYSYNPSTNQYLRSVGGAAHIDANDNAQLALDNVIVMEVPYSVDGFGYYHYSLTGTNPVHVFKNGEKITGQWTRGARTSSFRFTKAGVNIELNRGHTWITAIRPGNDVEVE